jgi:uncharacterized membrane protein
LSLAFSARDWVLLARGTAGFDCGSSVQKVLSVANAILVAGYPAAVYFGLLHFSARGVGLLLLGLLLPGLLYRLRRAPPGQLWAVLKLPLGVIALVGSAALFDDPRFVLALPVLINLLLLFGFASSLRETPMIERFARLQKAEISPEQVRYCRRVTLVWCAFFAGNAAVSSALACFASLASWALYTGLIAYVLIGLLGASEYVVRKARFREYGSGLQDRLLARVFPPTAGDGAPR